MNTLTRETRDGDRAQTEQFIAPPASVTESADGYMFEIDPSIDAEKISAKIDQGLVTLTLPKAEHVKPRKITVS